MTTLEDLWPLARLRVTCGDLSLEFLDDERLVALAALAGEGIHGDTLPFTTPWSVGTPSEVAQRVLAYQWGLRGRLVPEDWNLELAVVRGGEVLGVQGAMAKDFVGARTAETGSWLGRRHQGKGLGTAMRQMILHLLFEGFDAEVATTAAWSDNPASHGVTRRLGYVPNGVDRLLREGQLVESNRFTLTRAGWSAQNHPAMTIDGLDAAREQLGIPSA